MRQTNAGPSCAVPLVCQPPWLSSANPVVGVLPQARSSGPPNGPKSTTTVALDELLQPVTGSALAEATAAGSAPVSVSAVIAATTRRASPEPDQGLERLVTS